MTAIRRQDLQQCPPTGWRLRLGALAVASAIAATSAACSGSCGIGSASWGGPWETNTLTPAEFAAELASAAGTDKPVVVCTAPPFLYRVGRIPGSILHGPASSPEGLSSLKAWARPLPRSTSIVIYCGCCPLRDCPNLRPAYTALKDLGFTRVRVLLLPDNFKTDWVDRGYPVEK